MDPTVPSDDLAGCIDQHRNIEAEGFDAPRDLTDLAGTVRTGIFRIEFEFYNWPISDLHSARIGCRDILHPSHHRYPPHRS